jgi:hypothetical protein
MSLTSNEKAITQSKDSVSSIEMELKIVVITVDTEDIFSLQKATAVRFYSPNLVAYTGAYPSEPSI